MNLYGGDRVKLDFLGRRPVAVMEWGVGGIRWHQKTLIYQITGGLFPGGDNQGPRTVTLNSAQTWGIETRASS